MARKTWTKIDIENLLYLYNKKIPLKIIGNIFNTTANGISKTLQRYSLDHRHVLENNCSPIVDPVIDILKWMKKHYLFFRSIVHSNKSINEKTIAINKILYRHNMSCLNTIQISNIIYQLKALENSII